MEYYFEGTLVSLEFIVNNRTPKDNFPDKFMWLTKVVKEYRDEEGNIYGYDILYCDKNGGIKMGLSICEDKGIIFGKGVWIIPAYLKFRKVIQNYQ